MQLQGASGVYALLNQSFFGRLQVQDASGVLKLGCPMMANQRSSAN